MKLRFIFPLLSSLFLLTSFSISFRARASDASPERCFETIDYMNGIVQEATCPAAQPQTTSVRPTLSNRPLANLPWSNAFKGEGDLRRYIECYATEDGRYELFAKKYMPLIEKTAKAFDLPKAVFACLLFRESRFDITVVSPSGAIGLGQMLPSTMEHMTRLVQPVNQSFVSKMKELLGKAIPSAKAQAVKDHAYAKTIVKNSEFTASWENYVKDLSGYYAKFTVSECERRNPVDKKNPRKSADARKKCLKRMNADDHRTIDVETVKTDPAIAIGSAGLYLKTILKHFNDTLKNGKVQDGNDRRNYYLFLAAAGAYNMGPGAAQEILENVRPATPENWVEALKKSNQETAAHILSIQSCIEPASSKNDPWKAPIGSANRTCNTTSPQTLPGGPNELPKAYQTKIKSAAGLTQPGKPDKSKAEPKKTKKTDTLVKKKKKERRT